MQQKRRKPAQLNIQVNSGGCVLFCLFSLSPQQQGSASEEKGFFSALGNALGLGHKQQQQAPGLAPLRAPATQEGVAVLKFNPSRLLCQAEQLASELARHCGVVAPASRVILQVRPFRPAPAHSMAPCQTAMPPKCGHMYSCNLTVLADACAPMHAVRCHSSRVGRAGGSSCTHRGAWWWRPAGTGDAASPCCPSDGVCAG
jgi:hypothetical protein